jgi:hypothetical protein
VNCHDPTTPSELRAEAGGDRQRQAACDGLRPDRWGRLYVEVLPSGSKVWRYKYRRLGKREKVTIGPYPSIGIKAARDRHEALREQLHGGKSRPRPSSATR